MEVFCILSGVPKTMLSKFCRDDFKIVQNIQDDTLILTVSGCAHSLSLECYALIKDLISENNIDKVVMDMVEMKSMDSSMIGIMVALHSFGKKNDVKVKYINLNNFVHEMIKITHLNIILDIEGM